jgi:short-subunit dehydrogenase
MLARGRGTLAGVSSLAGARGMPASGSYSASKAALSTFLETVSVDLAGSGVRVVDLRPGFVQTPMTADNRFAMPFLLEVDDAARRCVRALERGRSVHAFPLPMALGVGLARFLPPRLWRRFARRFDPQARGSAPTTGADRRSSTRGRS